ncbi:S8 family serine peptidase [Sinosporangium siamense]|uniref:S8 family serine peptidase n=1 Tax=Sinosporangium siamense TaxID=1367973 RepID=UPI0035ED14BA
MSRSPRRWRPVLLGTLTALSLLLPQGTAQAAPAPVPESGPLPAKIESSLLPKLTAGGRTEFIVRLKEGADLGAAAKAVTKADKGAQVLAAKSAYADKSQAGVRELLTSRKAEFTPLWIVNAIKVKGDADLAREIAALAEVESIKADRDLPLPEAAPGTEVPKVNAVEWNIDRVGAPRVWNELGTRGEGIVVANIDTGVEYKHPALVEKYRGRKADGTFDHNYNWYGGSECRTGEPCDWSNHGTHTMGTMVGGTPEDTIGVAPGAKWIAAGICDFEHCSEWEMIGAGQWLLAPTDRTGRNPRPDLAPHIVNNSWGGNPVNRWWYKPILDAWIAAGIFPAFSNGNGGPECATSGSPGDNVEAYSAGAFDTYNAIAPFSSRGASGDGQIKPNIAAPGVNVRSANRSGYISKSGTSMASPHVAAAVALIWSAAPHVKGDVAATRDLLDHTAADVEDTSCGGTAARNNVWGEGKLDAYAAVRDAPQINAGLRGTLTSGAAPLEGAVVTLTGPSKRKIVSKADGTFALPNVRAGTYELSARKFGYDDATATLTIAAGQSAVQDLALTLQPRRNVTGTVTDAGTPDSPVSVVAAGTPESTATDAAGGYRLSLPAGTYTLKLTPPAGRCSRAVDVQVTVAGDTVRDIDLPRRTDPFGHGCVAGKRPYVAGTEKLPLSGFGMSASVALPFAFPFYGENHTKVWAGTSGVLDFDRNDRAWRNWQLPSPYRSTAIMPFWDDLVVDGQAGMYTATLGTAPHRTFVVEWRDVTFSERRDVRFSVSAALGENGSISFHYRGVKDALTTGSTATIGLEHRDSRSFSFVHEAAVLADGQSITFASPHGVLAGTVVDANDGRPLAGAKVAVGDGLTATTGQDGTYLTQVPVGDYQVTVSKEHYGAQSRPLSLATGGYTWLDTELITGRVSASLGEADLLTPANSAKSVDLVLTNLGGSATPFALRTEPAAGWLTATPADGTLAPGASTTVKLTVNSAGVPASTYRKGTLSVRSDSGRNPKIDIPVTMVVPGTRLAVDAGGTRDVTDSAGERWTADRAHTAGGHGYVSTRNRTHSTRAVIKGTADQALFQRAREGMSEYRFDNLANGYYTVELGFADTRHTRPERRVFDVYAEGDLAVPALDLAQEVGVRTATVRQYTVKVTDGQLNVRFLPRTGKPILNSIRVSDRPDMVTP